MPPLAITLIGCTLGKSQRLPQDALIISLTNLTVKLINTISLLSMSSSRHCFVLLDENCSHRVLAAGVWVDVKPFGWIWVHQKDCLQDNLLDLVKSFLLLNFPHERFAFLCQFCDWLHDSSSSVYVVLNKVDDA